MPAERDPRQLALDLGPDLNPRPWPAIGAKLILYHQYRRPGWRGASEGTTISTFRGILVALVRANEHPADRQDLIGKISPQARPSKYDRILLAYGNRRSNWLTIGPGWTWFLASEVG